MQTEGRLLILDAWFRHYCEDKFKEFLNELVLSTFQVVGKAEYFFEPQGFTRVYLLKESHIAVHTYPEHAYISADIYICNPSIDLDAIAGRIISAFPILTWRQRVLKRGSFPRHHTVPGLPMADGVPSGAEESNA